MNNQAGATLNNQSGGTLINESGGTLNNAGTLNNLNGGALNNGGTLTTVSGGVITNDGTLNNQTGGTVEVQAGGTLTNNASVNNAATFTVVSSGVVNGIGNFTQTAGTTTVDGSVTQNRVDIQGGSLQGLGSITTTQGVTIESGATIALENAQGTTGTFTVNGDFTLNGHLLKNISGTSAGSFGVLDVNQGTVSFGNGSLIDFFFGGFTQAAGMKWDFLFSDTNFVNLGGLGYQLNGLASGLTYHVNNVFTGGRYALELVLDTAPINVPEPGSLSLLGLGGLLLSRFRRRAGAAA